MAEFSGMAGFGGMGVGVLAWCHQQLRYERTKTCISGPVLSDDFLVHVKFSMF